MPRYFCDYCDAYLTKISPAARAQHQRGAAHRKAFRAYYEKIYTQQQEELAAKQQALSNSQFNQYIQHQQSVLAYQPNSNTGVGHAAYMHNPNHITGHIPQGYIAPPPPPS
jgi:hypothetical protein